MRCCVSMPLEQLLCGVHGGLRQRAFKHRCKDDQPVLCVQELRPEHLSFKRCKLQAEKTPHRIRCRCSTAYKLHACLQDRHGCVNDSILMRGRLVWMRLWCSWRKCAYGACVRYSELFASRHGSPSSRAEARAWFAGSRGKARNWFNTARACAALRAALGTLAEGWRRATLRAFSAPALSG